MTATQGMAPVAGTSLYYEVTGAGSPLVLLHGFSFDTRMWHAQVAALSARHTVVRYDLRGFGKSPPGSEPYTHAEDLLALLDHLGLARVSLLGLSLGGGAAINFTVLHPERVHALLLVDPSLGGFAWSSDFSTAQANLGAAASQLGVDAARALWLSMPMFQPAMRKPGVALEILRIVSDYSGSHWTTPDLGRRFSPPAIERLREIRTPTLVMVGEFDVPDFQGIADTLTRDIPGAQKLVLPGVGHMANMEDPAPFNAAVLEFLAMHGSGRSATG